MNAADFQKKRREIDKHEVETDEQFLTKYVGRVPRTMLQYTISKFPEENMEI